MSRVLIPYALHPLQYPQQGQNYVFNGCMKFLMECVGEKTANMIIGSLPLFLVTVMYRCLTQIKSNGAPAFPKQNLIII